MANTNKVLIPEAKYGLNQFKLEVANELGIPNYDSCLLYTSDAADEEFAV